jgi:hypothetical protein
MNKRDRFIAELREEAGTKGLAFRAETWRGKGGHMMVFVGDRLTTVPAPEIDPKTARLGGMNGKISPWMKGVRRCGPMFIVPNSSGVHGAAMS